MRLHRLASMFSGGALGLAALVAAPIAFADAIISNGTVQLGINDEGDLNVPGGTPSLESGATDVGLRYVPNNSDGTAAGCLCEGWGAADKTSGVTGYANESIGTANVTVLSFVADSDSATSVVQIKDSAGNPFMEVTHDYQPSALTPNLYAVTVTIKNVSAGKIDPQYRRVMDWDIAPTTFTEYSTVVTGAAKNLVNTSDGGFSSANPLSTDTGNIHGSFTDAGPTDHGALFDFDFDDLPPGKSLAFTIFYGAAGDEAGAIAALSAVKAEAYSFGQPATDESGNPVTDFSLARPDIGKPNTFIFAFAGVGGKPVFSSLSLSPKEGTQEVGSRYCLSALLLDDRSKPFPGATIVIDRGGANPGADTVVSDSTGMALYCYTGVVAGLDTIKATSGRLSDKAAVKWTRTIRSSALSAAPLVATVSTSLKLKGPLQLSSIISVALNPSATLTDPISKAPLAGRTVAFRSGNRALCTAKTDAKGIASCQANLVNVLTNVLSGILHLGYQANFDGDLGYSGSTAHGGVLKATLNNGELLKL